ncbi:MAG: hypothetical protein IPH13_21685 [Planctomycetes bacterium]|nr:hypothetical protein [Planctomycetota bacterium]MCC7171269.1 hypothetical protein [Planctomycetota bacterium]
MRVLVAAPRSRLDAFVRATSAALSPEHATCSGFAHDASRDPTIELPHRVFSERSAWVVLIQPRREDPATLDAVRGFGARIVVWFEVEDEAATERVSRARRRWLAHAADVVLAADVVAAADAVDRHGRAARVVGGEAFESALRDAVVTWPGGALGLA